MMQTGDEALYRAKSRGRNRVEHPARPGSAAERDLGSLIKCEISEIR
jgi:hypothetical protein